MGKKMETSTSICHQSFKHCTGSSYSLPVDRLHGLGSQVFTPFERVWALEVGKISLLMFKIVNFFKGIYMYESLK